MHDYRRVTPRLRAALTGILLPVEVGTEMMDRPRLLSGLHARRKELLEEISQAEVLLRQHYATLRSLDHLIRVEDPAADLPPVRNRKVPERQKMETTLARGEVSRLCLDALRQAPGEVRSSRQVMDYIVREKQLAFAAKDEENDFASSVTMALNRHAKRNIIERLAAGAGGLGQWRVPTVPSSQLPTGSQRRGE